MPDGHNYTIQKHGKLYNYYEINIQLYNLRSICGKFMVNLW